MTDMEIMVKYHPWEFLAEELKERNRSQTEFAELIGVPRTFVNDLIKWRKNITPKVAELFASALGISAEFRLNMQKSYDLFLLKTDQKLQEKKQTIERKVQQFAYA